MNEKQIFQALDAVFEALFKIKKVVDETCDPKDARMEDIDSALNRLSDILYVRNHENPRR